MAKKRVGKVFDLAKDRIPNLRVKITDITDEPEAIIKYGILTTPAIVIDGVLEFTKVPKEQELLKKLGL